MSNLTWPAFGTFSYLLTQVLIALQSNDDKRNSAERARCVN